MIMKLSNLNLSKDFLMVLFLSILVLGFCFYNWRIILLEKLNQSIKNKSVNLELIRKNISNRHSQIPQDIKNEKLLEKIAQETNVRIFAKDKDKDIEMGGTGVLIKKENNSYLVITNNHVINNKNVQYKISTHDGKLYNGKIIKQKNHDNQDDLAILKFDSSEEYNIIKIAYQPLIKHEIVFSSGFPFQQNLQQSQRLHYTMGNLAIILNKPLKGGYKLGYTNLVQNGMSGGSILNKKGELIGLNGLGKYPIFGNPYIYQDGVIIDYKDIYIMTELSWGIPVKDIENFVKNTN